MGQRSPCFIRRCFSILICEIDAGSNARVFQQACHHATKRQDVVQQRGAPTTTAATARKAVRWRLESRSRSWTSWPWGLVPRSSAASFLPASDDTLRAPCLLVCVCGNGWRLVASHGQHTLPRAPSRAKVVDHRVCLRLRAWWSEA
jgi:hypothetical protein